MKTRKIVIVSPKPTPAQVRALRYLDTPMMWDQWKGRWSKPRAERLREAVMWRCVGLRLVERVQEAGRALWCLSAAGRTALGPKP